MSHTDCRIRGKLKAVIISGTVVFGLSSAAFADSIKVAFNSSWSPYSEGSGSDVSGLLVDLTRSIIEDGMGYKVEAVGLPWNRAQREVKDNRLDALVTYASKERLAYTDASREYVYSLETKAFVRIGSDAEKAIRANPEIATHRGFKHCMILGDNWSKSFLEKNNLTFETGIDTAGCLRQVSAGRQDVFLHVVDTAQAALHEDDALDDIVMLPKTYSSVALSLLVSKESGIPDDFIRNFDKELAAMKQNGSYYAHIAELRGLPAPVQLATLDWPPYTGETLSQHGAVSEIVRRAFASADHDILPYFLPWNRAIAYAKLDHNAILGYYPGYHCHHDTGFIASDSLGKSVLGLAERSDNNIEWDTLEDLEGYRIGTVVGYANTEAFDKRVASGHIKVFTAHDDKSNLQNLAAGNIDTAIIDEQVLNFLMNKYPTLGKLGPTIRLDERLLEAQDLYLCVKDTEQGREIIRIFNKGLEQLDKDAIWQDFFLAGNG